MEKSRPDHARFETSDLLRECCGSMARLEGRQRGSAGRRGVELWELARARDDQQRHTEGWQQSANQEPCFAQSKD